MNFRRSELTSRKLFPGPPPVDCGGSARTVLAGKDSLRRADARPCLLRSVPADFNLRRAAPAGNISPTLALIVVHQKDVDSAGLLMEVADNTDEGLGGDSRKPVVNDNIFYHSLSPSCPGQDRAAGMDECVVQTPDLRVCSQHPEVIRAGPQEFDSFGLLCAHHVRVGAPNRGNVLESAGSVAEVP